MYGSFDYRVQYAVASKGGDLRRWERNSVDRADFLFGSGNNAYSLKNSEALRVIVKVRQPLSPHLPTTALLFI